jgi:hypothetical protein
MCLYLTDNQIVSKLYFKIEFKVLALLQFFGKGAKRINN